MAWTLHPCGCKTSVNVAPGGTWSHVFLCNDCVTRNRKELDSHPRDSSFGVPHTRASDHEQEGQLSLFAPS